MRWRVTIQWMDGTASHILIKSIIDVRLLKSMIDHTVHTAYLTDRVNDRTIHWK